MLGDKISLLQNVNFKSAPKYGATYADTPISNSLYQGITMLHQLPELEVVHIGHKGFDTYANQAQKHARLFNELADRISAAYTDLLTDELENMVVVITSEFGRTAQENGSNGTANYWLAIGSNFKGGIYGEPLSLDTASLYKNKYFPHMNDYRDIYVLLFNWMSLNHKQSAQYFNEYDFNGINFIT